MTTGLMPDDEEIRMRVKWQTLAGLLGVLALLAAGCGPSDLGEPVTEVDDAAAEAEPADDGEPAPDGEPAGDLGGEIVISGSSTVEPIAARNAEKWNQENPNVAISVDGPGTGDGFEIFCNGETDISDASRPIKPEEAEKCAANGIEFIELKLAIDGLSVITSTENDQMECLSFTDLYALLGPESTGFTSWSDANDLAAELASSADTAFGDIHAPYPDIDLLVSAPGEESGTYDSFIELAIDKIAEARGHDGESRPDYQASHNDNVIVEAISGTPTSLGWVGYAFVYANPEAVRALGVDSGDGCVEPTPETIASGEFPLARPLFQYVNAQRAEDNPALVSYVDFALSDEGLASVPEVGYVDLAEDEVTETRRRWESREIWQQAS